MIDKNTYKALRRIITFTQGKSEKLARNDITTVREWLDEKEKEIEPVENIIKELLEEVKKYIEECESSFMWEYSGNIVENEELFRDKKRMPKLYYKIIKLLK